MRNFLLDNAAATGTTLSDVASLFRSLMSNIIGPVLAIIGVAAVIYAVVLGVNYAKGLAYSLEIPLIVCPFPLMVTSWKMMIPSWRSRSPSIEGS